MPLNLGNFGAAAGGANVGIDQAQNIEARRFAMERARQQAAQDAANRNAQQAAVAAYRKTMMDVYGPAPGAGPAGAGPAAPGGQQPPMPGQASVPMQQPGPPPMPGTIVSPGGQPAPGGHALPPYRPLQRGAASAGPGGMPQQQFELPPKPARPQLDMQAVMRNAPQDPVAFEAYMERMGPYLSAQGKAEMEQQKLELQFERTRNQLLESEQRIANATTPAERQAALEANLALKNRLADIAQQNADTKRAAAGEKKTKGSEKKAESDSSRRMALDLVRDLRAMVARHPEVVGLRGKATRGMEAVGGMFGGDSSVAHDFQQKVRALQNIIKKVEPYGPEGRVLKGELADRDALVEGLGAWTSAPNALSGFNNLEQWLSRTAQPAAGVQPGTAPAAGGRAEAPAAALAYLKANNDATHRKAFKEKYGYLP